MDPRRAHFTMRPSAASVTCRDVPESLWEYIDGALHAPRASAMRAHLRGCRRCRARHDEAVAVLRAAARTRGSDPAPDHLRERIDALLREHGLR
ncbi:MAG: zf-HC2 domain-containing protein [Gemmatimonadetes bacterium]|nr:zf-HC2 domain-containing protein [Gemmatimonadota bacterium]